MIKVVIADDEVRICQLILALVDWEALGLKVVGTAHNGLEAIAMVRTLQPDILITDIRMPGCSGLELIDQVKRDDQSLEIVIISGYAHFEYAQQAIKYGVGDYLLKPISKTELTATLQKLAGRICAQKKNAEDEAQQKKKTQKDVALLRENLISGLLDQKNRKISIGELQEQYGLQVQDGVFQAFLLKMDCGREELSPTASVLLMEKAQEGLAAGGRRQMPGVCIGGAGLCLRRNFKLCTAEKRGGAPRTEELYQSAGTAEKSVPAGQLFCGAWKRQKCAGGAGCIDEGSADADRGTDCIWHRAAV